MAFDVIFNELEIHSLFSMYWSESHISKQKKPAKEKHPEMPQRVLIGRVWITEAINIWEEGCNEQADPLG